MPDLELWILLYRYFISERVIVKNVTLRNMITDQGEAEFDNNIPNDDIFTIALSEMIYLFYYIPNFYTRSPFYIKQNHELLNLINTQNL